MIHSDYQPNYRPQATSLGANTNNQADIRKLENEVDRLSIICEALWEFIRERHGLQEIDLIEKMTQIDLQDGHLDGKKRKEDGPRVCKRCERTMLTDRPVCLYCGEVSLQNPF
ncbi:MAG: hypothetical protein AAFX93_11905 [Verrucomicrobiota bacterium]